LAVIFTTNRNWHIEPFTTFGQIFFKRKYLRSVQGKALNVFYTLVNKDRDTLSTLPADSYKYGVFHLNYIYSNPALINNFLFNADVEIGNQFTKLYSEVKFRKMTDSNQQFEARLFAGVFLTITQLPIILVML
jgi:hypothetical protein